ncbi:hypothetical protein [Calothrix sp. 336/3]|uniref:hypothetical protein n=1 Tax=Calothrix sp. 336/3 TaxID=1337936 RepID=UPI000A3EF85A|nr:hypothetical protein [Calothrix sp. 336/3]
MAIELRSAEATIELRSAQRAIELRSAEAAIAILNILINVCHPPKKLSPLS